MDTSFKQQILQRARDFWDDGQPYQTGKVIFECIPVDRRHVWAYDILNLAYPYFARDPRVDALLEFARDPLNWGVGQGGRDLEAHRIVCDVNTHQNLIFCLAAQAGKIVYTAQQYPAPFDHAAGWKIAVALWQIDRKLCDHEFDAQAWSILANQALILLEQPMMCHPACPSCTANGLTPMSKQIAHSSIQRE